MQKITKAFKYVVLSGLFFGLEQHINAQEIDSTGSSLSKSDSIAVFDGSSDLKGKTVVKGYIKNSVNGEGLAGANVSVPGFSAAITDEKGYFILPVPTLSTLISVQAQGYQNKEVALKGRSEVEVQLFDDTFNSKYEEVLLPYGKRVKNHYPYAIESFNLNDSWNRGTESPDAYLQGKAAGYNAIRRSGTPGTGANVMIRGINSINASAAPLYIVDGIIYDNTDFGISLIGGHSYNPLQSIDIKDIDNITILKDAAAAAYGTRGSNGVVLINTLRAKEQVTKIDAAIYGGFNVQPKNTPVMDAGQYKIYLADVLKSQGLSQNQIDNTRFFDESVEGNPDYYRYHYNTNWQDQVMQNSYNQNYYLKVTGGDNIATYGLSLGYLKSEGVTKGTDLKRYQTRFNADLNLSQKVKAFANLSFTSNNQNLKDQGATNTNPIFLAQVKSPFLSTQEVSNSGAVSPNLAEVDVFNRSNPLALINNGQYEDNNYRFLGSFGLNYLLNKQITLQSTVGVTFDKVREKLFIPQKGVASDTLDKAVVLNRSGSYVSRLYSIYNDTRINYTKAFDVNNELKANAGIRYNINQSETDFGFGFNSATDEFVSVTSGQAALRRVSGNNGDWNWLSFYANADYVHAKKYFVSFNVAMDASSRFGEDADGFNFLGNPYAVMPSVGLGWLLSSEDFMKDVDVVENLKLRASYGLTGNYDIGNYSAQQLYISQNFLGVQGLVRGNIANPQLKWERVTKANIGLDASFFNERLNFSVDLYKNKADDLIIFEPIDVATGLDYAITNNGAMETNGIDLSLGTRIVNRAVKWDLSLNLSSYKNKVTQIPNGSMTNAFAGEEIYITKVGGAANMFYGFQSNGIYRTSAEAGTAGLSYKDGEGNLIPFGAGDMRFVDQNGDNVIDENDRTTIGNPNPDFIGGIGNNLSYKNWSFDAMFTFSSGNDIYNYSRRQLESMNNYNNQTVGVINRWRVEGQQTDVPKTMFGDPAGNARFSDRWIEDGSYFRLKTASVAYNFSFEKSAIKYAKIYLTGNNLFTLTKYLGYDPEFSAGNGLFAQGTDVNLEPQFRSVQLGIRVGL